MNKLILGTVGGLVLGLGSGYFIGNSGTPSSVSNTSSETPSNPRKFGENKILVTDSPRAGQKSTKISSLEEALEKRSLLKKTEDLVAFYKNLSPEQLAEEARKLENLPWEDRMISSQLLFAKWGETAPKQALEYAGSMMGMGSRFAKQAIIQSWAVVDPVNAANYYKENINTLGSERTAGSIAGEWARLDANAALNWANSLNAGDKVQATASVFRSLADIDPAMAATKLATLSADDPAQKQAIDAIATQWATKDWAATEAWLNTLPADLRDNARSSALESLAQSNPAAAAAQLSSLPPGRLADNLAATIAQSMARTNPAEAAAWLAKNSASERTLQRSMPQIVNAWVNSDTQAAKAWVSNLPQGETRDSAIMYYATQSPDRNYAATLQFVGSIGNKHLGDYSTSEVVSKWMREDPTAAQNWINSSQLSDETKQRIERMTSGSRRGGPGGHGDGGRGGRGGRGGH